MKWGVYYVHFVEIGEEGITGYFLTRDYKGNLAEGGKVAGFFPYLDLIAIVKLGYGDYNVCYK